MASVYLADDVVEHRSVAIKILKPELANAVAAERFLREVRLVQTLKHPNIIPLLDVGESGGVPYYVMPYVDGGNVRQLIRRHRQLARDDTLRIAEAVGDALGYAHGQEIVHRDVKPENILLSGREVLLADFGIARAVSEAAGDTLTDSGIVLGTPGYMSPEQASGEHEIDRRSDVYALSAVVYEMLAGEPPYSGPTLQAVVAKQLTLPVPPIRVVRDTLSEHVEDVLRKGLARTPADRFDSAPEFVAALRVALAEPPSPPRRVGPRRLVVGGASLVVAVAAVVVLATRATSHAPPIQPDTTRVLAFPLAVEADGRAPGPVPSVRDALRRWAGVSLPDERSLQDALAGRRSDALSNRDAARIASEVRAGRFLRGSAAFAKDSTRFHLQLFDAGDASVTLMREASGAVANGSGATALLASLVDSLLLGDAMVDGDNALSGTTVLPARQAYGRGRHAMDAWKLSVADSAFTQATLRDPGFAAAHLWLAMARAWAGVDVSRWRIPAAQALTRSATLSASNRLMAQAIEAQSRGDLEPACAAWQKLSAQDSVNAFAWYGLASCLTRDDIVVPDARSPSGFRFRGSYHRALVAYQRAFRLHPPILSSFRGEGLSSMWRLFRTAGNSLRGGRSAASTSARFTARMSWQGDTLVFIPYPSRAGEPTILFGDERQVIEAVSHQREMVRGVASAWVSALPGSSDAWQALALALASLGDASALDTLARAAALAATPQEQARAVEASIALHLAFGLRGPDTVLVRIARRLADSVLHAPRGVVSPLILCSLAALTGRANRAAEFARSTAVADQMNMPPALRAEAPPLLLHAALGGPSDSLDRLEQLTRDAIARSIPLADQRARRMEVLGRAASMAFPWHRFADLAQLAGEGDPLVAAQWARARGDTIAPRRALELLARERREIAPEGVTFDALMPEAALWLSLSQPQRAARWLEPTMSVLPRQATTLLSNPVMVASLARATWLRARLATATGDSAAARRWNAAVRILWSDADPFLARSNIGSVQ